MAPLPLPVLTLRLSSPSFLETILTHDAAPVYSTETYQNSTTLSRCLPHGLSLIATIRWPEHSPKGKCKDAPCPQVTMDGCIKSEDDLLRRNVLNTSRKFYIPGHSQPLKWRRVQGVFQCTAAAGALVAVFEPAILTARARLSVFVHTLAGLPEPQGGAVSCMLTDYLIATALLLLTHPQDWRGFAPSPVVELPHLHIPYPAAAPSYSTPVSPITSACEDADIAPYPLPFRRDAHEAPQPAPPKVTVTDYEAPPPYEEIQWTVRVRQPRPRRT